MNWYCPYSDIKEGPEKDISVIKNSYSPWYSDKFSSIEELIDSFSIEHDKLLSLTSLFSETFYNTDLPESVIDAVAANLSILKSPTCLRQTDGRLWMWEGCCDTEGSCYGSCQHVCNYAQAVCHLFPRLERYLREIDFNENMDSSGHQQFRTPMPIRKNLHTFYAASDGQPGSIIKMYREWRISGDNQWLLSYWDKIILSMEYCIKTWDPEEKGAFTEPHHNTYDIEFWGAEPMCSSYYLAALKAVTEMGKTLKKETSRYEEILSKGIKYFEEELYNGEYFIQKTQWKNLHTEFKSENDKITEKEGPKYQYGDGLLSDGLCGFWLAQFCGLGEIIDGKKIISHLKSIYKYNFRTSLHNHANTERPGYAFGNEGGILVCTWPHGNEPALSLVYKDEVFTGIEYEIASYLAKYGCYEEAEKIIRTLRDRYDGEKRNPFDEYECGHWYIRALSSYALIEAFSGLRYDAVTKTLYIKKKNQKVFLSADKGFGTVTVKDEKVSVNVKYGKIIIDNIILI